MQYSVTKTILIIKEFISNAMAEQDLFIAEIVY